MDDDLELSGWKGMIWLLSSKASIVTKLTVIFTVKDTTANEFTTTWRLKKKFIKTVKNKEGIYYSERNQRKRFCCFSISKFSGIKMISVFLRMCLSVLQSTLLYSSIKSYCECVAI